MLILLMYSVNDRDIGAKTDKNEEERVQRAKLQAEAAERSLLIIISYPIRGQALTLKMSLAQCLEILNY